MKNSLKYINKLLIIILSALVLSACSNKLSQSDILREEKLDAMNRLASIKGLKSITYSRVSTENEEQVFFLDGPRLPDYVHLYFDVRMIMDDGTEVIELKVEPFNGIYEYVDNATWMKNDPAHYIIGAFSPSIHADLLINGKEISFYPYDESDKIILKEWQKAHIGKTYESVSFTDSNECESVLKLTNKDLEKYQKWEEKNAE